MKKQTRKPRRWIAAEITDTIIVLVRFRFRVDRDAWVSCSECRMVAKRGGNAEAYIRAADAGKLWRCNPIGTVASIPKNYGGASRPRMAALRAVARRREPQPPDA